LKMDSDSPLGDDLRFDSFVSVSSQPATNTFEKTGDHQVTASR
jgi:hypothetical protein